MKTEQCQNCRFWKRPNGYSHIDQFKEETHVVGPCRKRSPQIIAHDGKDSSGFSYSTETTEWPIVSANDWCGDFEPSIGRLRFVKDGC